MFFLQTVKPYSFRERNIQGLSSKSNIPVRRLGVKERVNMGTIICFLAFWIVVGIITPKSKIKELAMQEYEGETE